MDLKHPNSEHKISPEEWDKMSFEHKNYCYLKDGCLLELKATEFFPERTLTSLGSDNAEIVIETLIEKFKEITAQLNELELEWLASEDKIKLESKIIRFKEQLFHVNALGNYKVLFLSLNEKLDWIEGIYQDNYQHRLTIVEQIEGLAKPEETEQKDNAADTTSISIHDLNEAWKNAPEVRKKQYDILSLRFDKAREDYYENKHKSQEAWEHELMQNLDKKMEICEKAERLAHSEEWRETTEAFKILMEEWKIIGPVPSTEKNEILWQQFSAARNTFFEKKKQNFEAIQKEQEANLILKTELVEQAEAIQNQTNWKETAQSFTQIMNEWKKIGKVPYEKASDLWQRLQAARDSFFSAKRESAKVFKESLEVNYKFKKALAEQADSLKDATNWHEVTLQMNKMMQEWKNGGPIPREYGNEIWDKFITARKHFFERKDTDREKRQAKFHHQINNRLHQTTQFLDKITSEFEEDEDKLNDFKTSLSSTTGESAKEEELRQHLKNLIEQIESQQPRRLKKIEEVKKQKTELEERCKEVNGKNKNHNNTNKINKSEVSEIKNEEKEQEK